MGSINLARFSLEFKKIHLDVACSFHGFNLFTESFPVFYFPLSFSNIGLIKRFSRITKIVFKIQQNELTALTYY